MSAITFKEIVDAVLNERFDETQRGDAGQWVNHRLGWIWALENWVFKLRTSAVSVTSGSSAVTNLPVSLGPILGFNRSDGTPLVYLPPAAFFDLYFGDTSTGTPQHYTVINGTVRVGPVSNETSAAYQMLDEQRPTVLNNDNDVPGIPTEFHFALVHGGSAEGLKLQNDPTWQAFEQDFQASITAMRKVYLVDQRGSSLQYGADNLDGGYQEW